MVRASRLRLITILYCIEQKQFASYYYEVTLATASLW